MILADDHVMFREGMRPFLERLAPEVEILEAGSLAEVMGHLDAAAGEVGLVVLDLKMPGMVGALGIRQIKEAHPPVPIVVLSAVVDRLQVVDSINNGASGFIPKRLSGAAMLSALQLVLAGERFVPYLALAPDDAADMQTPPLKHADCLSMLTKREKEILTLLKDGLSNKAIAACLTVSEVTVKSHLCSIFRKMGVQNRVQAIRCFLGGDL
jgi:DNA-binding NarL/FixJ family response regulator